MNPSFPSGPIPLDQLWLATLLCFGAVALVALLAWLKTRGDD